MKIYVFEDFNGVICRVAKSNIDDAITWFEKTYPTKKYSFVHEQ